ncbi:MAG: PAS domain-containing protein, partial [Bdellovibrionales bacterium]|nr:PAS domain-containing protein [Bdellovibrionales bacterium]
MAGFEPRLATQVVESLLSTFELRRVLANAAEHFGVCLGATRAVVLLDRDQFPPPQQPPIEWSADDVDPARDPDALAAVTQLQSLARRLPGAYVTNNGRTDAALQGIKAALERLDVGGLLAVSARAHGIPTATVVVFRAPSDESWTEEEVAFAEYVARVLGIAVNACMSMSAYEERFAGSNVPTPETPSLCSVVRFDARGYIRSVNQMVQDLTGLSSQELLGLHFGEYLRRVVAPEDLPAVRHAYESGFNSTLMAHPVEYRLRHRDMGVLLKVLDQFGPRKHGDGFESVAIDITEHAHLGADGQGSASEERYRRLVEHSDAIIFHCDTEHTITFVSRRALDFFGVAPEDFLAGTPVHWYDLVHLDDRDRVRRRADEMQRASGSFDEEFRVI